MSGPYPTSYVLFLMDPVLPCFEALSKPLMPPRLCDILSAGSVRVKWPSDAVWKGGVK
jgi:hypothetical protein